MMESNEIDNENYEIAIFAGGCFWCMEQPYYEQSGVVEVTSGYSGGTTENPDYEEVSSGRTDHFESVRITFDAEKVTYLQLVEIFWSQIDPTDDSGQFADRGNHYKTAIFFSTEEQKRVAELSKKDLENSGVFSKPIATMILPATRFYLAEEYHQKYFLKNEIHYNAYKKGSGRLDFIDLMWKKRKNSMKRYVRPSEEFIHENLSTIEYEVTQKDGTEPPFNNTFWKSKEKGIFVDIVSGEPLFSSVDKFDSGTGWPSFIRPLESDNIVEKVDRKLFNTRTEVRSKYGDSHLGHVFPDGPEPSGLRYCINSAALRFIPIEDLEKEGYGEYRERLTKK